MNDKSRRRMATAISLLFALIFYWMARSGWLGHHLALFSTKYLVIMLCVLSARTALIELGIRRPKQAFL